MNLLWISVMSMLSGLFYWCGGRGDDGHKRYPFIPRWCFNTKMRDFGCPLVSILLLLLLGIKAENWQWFIYFCLSFAAMTTYHKWLNKIFKTATDDVYWYSWVMTGLCYGIPLVFIFNPLQAILRAILLGLLTMFWSEEIGQADTEEFGRGFIYVFSLIIIQFINI